MDLAVWISSTDTPLDVCHFNQGLWVYQSVEAFLYGQQNDRVCYLLSRELKITFCDPIVDEANAAEAGFMDDGSVVCRFLASSAVEMFDSRSPDVEEGILLKSLFAI